MDAVARSNEEITAAGRWADRPPLMQWSRYVDFLESGQATHPRVHRALRQYADDVTGRGVDPRNERALLRHLAKFLEGSSLEVDPSSVENFRLRVTYRSKARREELWPTAPILWNFVEWLRYLAIASHKPELKRCARCGELFADESQAYSGRFCGNRCKVAASREARP